MKKKYFMNKFIYFKSVFVYMFYILKIQALRCATLEWSFRTRYLSSFYDVEFSFKVEIFLISFQNLIIQKAY